MGEQHRGRGFWASVLLLLLVVLPMRLQAAEGFYTQAGRIYDAAGTQVALRGINHFGFSSGILQPMYLWEMGWKEQIAQIKSLGFTAIRVPFTPDTLYSTEKVDDLSWVDPDLNPELLDKTPLQVLDLWMAEANRQGLYVVLDMHSISNKRTFNTWFTETAADATSIYNGQPYTAESWIRDLKFVAARYQHLDRFLGIDLYNEPHGQVRWSTGTDVSDSRYFWKAAAERAGAAILAVNPRLLIFVQGLVANNDGIEDSDLSMNWGENLQPQAYQPLSLPSDKLVLSPHTYGPDVYVKSVFEAPNFPANLAAGWETLFGQFSSRYAVVPGEWGGKYGEGDARDVAWQNALVDYLLSKDMRDGFYWCYTPNSTDTGGILDDDLVVREDKMALLRRLWGSVLSSIELAATSYVSSQSATAVTVVVNRSGSPGGAATVQYATASGSAVAGTDFTAISGTLSWAAGDSSSRTISIPIRSIAAYTGTRTFSLALTNPANAVLGGRATASITLSGIGAVSRVGFTAASYSIKQGKGSITITVARSGSSSGAVSVSVRTVDGTARAGRDYTATSGTLSWKSGASGERSIKIPISNATAFSGTRNFSVSLSAASGSPELTTSAATVTITGRR